MMLKLKTQTGQVSVIQVEEIMEIDGVPFNSEEHDRGEDHCTLHDLRVDMRIIAQPIYKHLGIDVPLFEDEEL